MKHKFFATAIMALLCVTTASAQDITARIPGLEKNKEYMDLLRSDGVLRQQSDSIVNVIRVLRGTLRDNAEALDSLAQVKSDSVLTVLSDAEDRMLAMRTQKIKLIDRINAIEQEFVLSGMGNIDDAAQAAQSAASIFGNSYFKRNIDPDDYKSLMAAQAKETEAREQVNSYINNYEQIRRLYDKYVTARTEADAESVYAEMSKSMDDNLVLERQLAKTWSEIYDQKTYVYSYFLEKENREDILEMVENLMGEVRQEKLQSIDNCVSEAVADYCLQKPIVLNYEMYVAKLLNQAPAIDSLSNASRSVRQIDYRMPKIDVVRRSFVDYSAIEFNPKSPYNSSNPIPDCVAYEYGTVYRILLGTYKYKQAVSVFRGASPLCIETLEDGRFCYYAGGFKTRAEAEKALEIMGKKGFRNPQIVEWCDGRKTNLSEQADGEAVTFRLIIKGESLDDTVKDVITTMAANCQLSKTTAGTFLVGTFDSRAMAERVAQAVMKCDSTLVVEVEEIKPQPAEETQQG